MTEEGFLSENLASISALPGTRVARPHPDTGRWPATACKRVWPQAAAAALGV